MQRGPEGRHPTLPSTAGVAKVSILLTSKRSFAANVNPFKDPSPECSIDKSGSMKPLLLLSTALVDMPPAARTHAQRCCKLNQVL